MADLGERLEKAREHVQPAWTPERERRVRERVAARLELGRQRRVVALSFAALAFVVAALLVWRGSAPLRAVAMAPHEATRVGVSVSPEMQELLHFEDGSTVTAITANAKAEPLEVAADRVTVRLAAGTARFSVTPNPLRTFRVRAEGVTVTVLGTVFTVAIEQGVVRVKVERGRVNVTSPAGERTLALGEEAVVPAPVDEDTASAPAPEETVAPAEETAAPPERRAAGSASASPSGPSWRALAEEGNYARAFAKLQAEGSASVHDEPGDLLLAADVARLGGHPERAVAPLSRVLAAHRSDSRAPLAAFTLGRTLLDQLGKPHEAARAFATARELDPRGAIAEDALAREVESWSRAGSAETARDRAEAYVKAYPKGRRLEAVRRLGGLE